MHSIRTRITSTMIVVVLISISLFGIIGSIYVTSVTDSLSIKELNLICKNRSDSLNEYLISIEQSVNMIKNYAVDSLDVVELEKGGAIGAQGETVEEIPGRTDKQRRALDKYFDEHLAEVEKAFKSVANHTNGVSTCYYRINPEITSTEKGFYFSKYVENEFQQLHLTKIENYEPDDLVHVGWYHIPLKNGKPTWLDPYNTANPGGWVMSYACPMFKYGTFIGIIGMDIHFDTLTEPLKDFTDFKTGYFLLADKEGLIYYHPEMTIEYEPINAFPQVIDQIKDMRKKPSDNFSTRYKKNGEKWVMTYTPLENGLRLAAVVKQSEINASAYKLMGAFATTGLVILLIFSVFIAIGSKHLAENEEK